MTNLLEKLFRKRILWVFFIPLIALLILSGFQLNFIPIFAGLFYWFPVGIIAALNISEEHFGPTLNMGMIIFSMVIYASYLSFIVFIRKISRGWLLSLSIFFLLLFLMGMKGCIQMIGEISL